MHTQFNPCCCALCNSQKFNSVAQLLGVLDVCCTQLGNAFYIGLVKLNRNAKCQCAHQGRFVGCVNTLNVEGWIRLCITQALSFFQDNIKVEPLVAHLRQNEVGRAIDDACDPLDTVGCQTFSQCFDDGNTACHSGFKCNHHTFGMRCCKNFSAMDCQQGFVGGDDVLASSNRFQDQRFGNPIATNQLNHNVDVGVGNDLSRIADHFDLRTGHGLRFGHVKVGHHANFNATTSTSFDF